NLKEPKLTRIQVELHRIIKRSPNVGSRGANFSWPIQQICYPMVIARFLMTNAINQLFEHHNQNVSTRSIKNLIQ
ncbi:unnamed protein product, partial [Rotaria sp. Silwood1]